MGQADAIVLVVNAARAVYSRLADGEILSQDEVVRLDPGVLHELRVRADRNRRRLIEEAGTLRLTARS
jgi:hypothetical protein